MAIDGRDSKIWIVVNRLDSGGIPSTEKQSTIPLLLPEGKQGDEIQQLFRDTLEITDNNLVLKLRNTRGSLIPINSYITPNSKFMPYTLEVVQQYQNYKPMARTVKLNGYNEMLKKRLQQIVRRLENLEKLEPELRTKREEKIRKEMEELNEKMTFLNKRMQDAESHKWQGMFKKHPLW
ncbi:uncharacterized protein [Amphiura filiformis]|uniref:uncharacterized protein n=1 Tax=Amphiura filiformis TaxID=82378 RepID=UPI003B226D55